MVNDWHNNCSFVVMEQVTITVKVIGALINQKYLVTKKYFEDMVYSADSLQKFNKSPIEYVPAVGEDDLEGVSFEPNAVRKVLFASKTFIFFDGDELKKMQNLIELASGKCQMFNKSKHLSLRFLRVNEGLIFMSSSGVLCEGQRELNSLLVSLGHRICDQTEIGFAILFASIEKHCCPVEVVYEKALGATIGSQTQNQSRVMSHNDINSNTQYNDMVLAAFDTQDTAPFEYERDKINETLKVDNTPEKKSNKRPRLPVVLVVDTPEKRETRNSSPIVKDSPVAQMSAKKAKHCESLVDSLSPELMVDENSTRMSANKAKYFVADTLSPGLEVGENLSETKPVIKKVKKASRRLEVKEETIVGIESSVPVASESTLPVATYTKVRGTVLSKSKPDSSFKNEELVVAQTSQLRVKFERLVRATKCEPDDDEFGSSEGKRNFKKFRKVPKKLHDKENDNGQFRNVCTNQPFDLNSQFDSFMNAKG